MLTDQAAGGRQDEAWSKAKTVREAIRQEKQSEAERW